MSARIFDKLSDGDGYFLLDVTDGVRLEFRHIRWQWHQLAAEVSVECEWAGAQCLPDTRIIFQGDLKLSDSIARQQRAKYCAERSRSKPADFDWLGFFDDGSYRVNKAEREGEPLVTLAEVIQPEQGLDHRVHGWMLPRHDMAVIMGDGGTGKSTLALYFAGELEARGERVLIVDYETNCYVQAKHAAELFGAVPRGILHLGGEAPLVEIADGLRRKIRREEISFAILDSVAEACHTPAEDSATATAVNRLQRSTKIGWLNICHVKGSTERGKERPFGSVFWWNGPRTIWALNSAPYNGGLACALRHAKENNGVKLPAVGFQIDYHPGRIDVTPTSVLDNPELADGLPIWQRMQHAIRQAGPLKDEDLAEQLGEKVETIARTARNMKVLFNRERGFDGKSRTSLAERK